MADKQPVAIRVVRPFDSEDEFLDNEIDTLTRTTIVLLGAQQRPDGVVLRFEVSLRTGAALVRGEGRVVAYKPNAHHGEPGLMLRFTRLDSRSKALVDRAAARRDARKSLVPPAPSTGEVVKVPSDPKLPSSGEVPKAASGEVLIATDSREHLAMAALGPGPGRTQEAEVQAVAFDKTMEVRAIDEPIAKRPEAPPMEVGPPPVMVVQSKPRKRESNDGPSIVAAPPDRESILERLRARARALPQDRVEAILRARRM